MNTVLHKASTRGHANHGWLDTWHTFSFGVYHDPARMHFGALRVLNDATVNGGMGFGKHPYENMEIVSIVLEGELEHANSLGNVQVIAKGDVQLMSAGTGVVNAEKNKNPHLPVRFLQIWIVPNKHNTQPRYEQQHFSTAALQKGLTTAAAPIESHKGVHIQQDARLSLGYIEKGSLINYKIKKEGNGVYAFLLEGDVTINDIVLNRRYGLGISSGTELQIKANLNAFLLLIDVPL